MSSICGAKCEECQLKEECNGCSETCGKPFGGSCVAAEYIKIGGTETYRVFKENLRREINDILISLDIPEAEQLYELSGSFVNLGYLLPSGQTVRFLDDTKIYLGCQIELPDRDVCCGVVADSTFILICTYGMNGSQPEILLYKPR